jgi:type II secretory pathway pseudopilin PulG
MMRLLELIVALIIVAVLGVLFGVTLPDHRHIERTTEVSSPVRQIYDVIDGFRAYPSWTALRAYDPKVQLNLVGPEQGDGASVNWVSGDARLESGSYTVSNSQQDKSVQWNIVNNWRGENKKYVLEITPAPNGKTVKITMGYDVDYGWDLLGRYSGMYLEGDPATQIQIHLQKLQDMLATFPNVDYKDTQIDLKDVEAKPVLFVSTTAKRTLDEVADATDKALTLIQAAVKKDKLTVAGPRITITSNWGDENYDFDVALPVDRNDGALTDPVKAGTSYGGKALVTSFTGSPAQLPLARLMLKAYAETHGYLIDESGEGSGRAYDELTSPAGSPEDAQSFNVYLPVQMQ